jgi:hypothetical protein
MGYVGRNRHAGASLFGVDVKAIQEGLRALQVGVNDHLVGIVSDY